MRHNAKLRTMSLSHLLLKTSGSAMEVCVAANGVTPGTVGRGRAMLQKYFQSD